ncbi:Uncharacterised protein [uncultured archaeon]|nr:Uncharacterised protein [uncultured archaeon]
MQKLSNVELHFIAKELQCLVKSRLIKVYCTGERQYRFKFKKEGLEYSLQVVMPQGMYLSHYTEEGIENDFVKALRKRISNWIVDSVTQFNSDRVIIIELGRNKLYFDFIGKGNILLLNNNIIELLESEDEKRKLEKGMIYSVPEVTKKDFDEFNKVETIFDLNLPKRLQESLSNASNWKTLLQNLLNKPAISIVKDQVVASFEGPSDFNSLSEALDSINRPEVVLKKNPNYVKLIKRLEEQEGSLKKTMEKLVKTKEYAEFLNRNKWLLQEKIKNKEYKENDNEILIELD